MERARDGRLVGKGGGDGDEGEGKYRCLLHSMPGQTNHHFHHLKILAVPYLPKIKAKKID